MITFFGILLILLIINAFLLIFSVNKASNRIKKPIRTRYTNTLPKLYTEQYAKAEFKEAV